MFIYPLIFLSYFFHLYRNMPSDEAIPYMALEVRSFTPFLFCPTLHCSLLFTSLFCYSPFTTSLLHFFPLKPSSLNCFLSVQADGNWETLEFGKSKVSGEYIVEEEPDDTRPNGVTR